MTKKSSIVWTMAGLAGWIYALLWWVGIMYSEVLAGIAVKKGNLTFFGWCLTVFLMVVTWLMVWRMLKEIRYRTSISTLLAFIVAICMGLMEAMYLGAEWPFVILGIQGMIIIMGLAFGCLLAPLFICIGGKIVTKIIFRNETQQRS